MRCQIADNGTELAEGAPRYVGHTLKDDIDRAQPTLNARAQLILNIGRTVHRWDVAQANPGKRLLNDLRFGNWKPALEDWIEPSNLPTVHRHDEIVAPSFERRHDWQRAAATAASVRDPGCITRAVPNEWHIGIQKPRADQVAQVPTCAQAVVDEFDKPDFRPEM